MSTAITATGIRGFLLWLKQQQPGIYQRVAPKLPSLVPEAFTSINRQTMGKLRAIYKSGMTRRTSQALGCYGSYATCVLPEITVEAPAEYQTFPTVNYTNLSAPICVGPISTPDELTCPTVDTGTDVASAANTGNAAASTTAAIATAVNAVAQTALTAAELSNFSNIVAAQLQNAQSGVAPRNVSTSSLGIPTVKASTSSSDLIWLLLAGLGAWAVLS